VTLSSTLDLVNCASIILGGFSVIPEAWSRSSTLAARRDYVVVVKKFDGWRVRTRNILFLLSTSLTSFCNTLAVVAASSATIISRVKS